MTSIAAMRFADLAVGQSAGFDVLVSAADIDRFAELSGDVNPLHTDASFARSRGHADRVVHGAFLSALVSRLAGVHLPGRDCLIHSMGLEFRSPLTVGARIRVEGVVDQLSEAVQAAVLKVCVTDLADGRQVATGKVRLGFTSEIA
jgi:3-hydroxybutyryl-CoA dehydratase